MEMKLCYYLLLNNLLLRCPGYSTENQKMSRFENDISKIFHWDVSDFLEKLIYFYEISEILMVTLLLNESYDQDKKK